jgi:imidazolonepropionase-like amidohydrolase
MNALRLCALAGLSAFLLAGLAAAPAAAQTTAIVGATLIDGTGAPPVPDAVVLIEGAHIAAVGPRARIRIPPGARQLDATGQFIIPGLIDTNVHLILNTAEGWVARYEHRLEEVATEAAQVALKNGLTTVFDSWGPLQSLVSLRERIRRGELPGPRLYVAGNIIGLSGPLGRDFKGAVELAAVNPSFAARVNQLWEEGTGPELLDLPPDKLREAIRRYIARGPDFLKVATASHISLALTHNFLMFSPQALAIIVEEARRAGLHVQSHSMNIASLRLAVEAGMDMGQHPEVIGAHELPDDLIRQMVERGFYCGVLSKTRARIRAERELWEFTGGRAGTWPPAVLDHWQANIEKLIRAGARLALATDAGTRDPEFTRYPAPHLRADDPTQLGQAHFLWLESIVEKGMTPMQALVAATRNAAAAYALLDQFGTLEPGKFADLVILDANPLNDIANVRRIAQVMKEGQLVDRDSLPQRQLLTQ